jgi:pimeloyl-ACP methyl ester carboxylesterase
VSAAPGRVLLYTDYGRSVGELGSLACTWPMLTRAPHGDGHPVLILPGLQASDRSTYLLHRFLRRLGYRTYGWGLGRNIGPTETATRGMRQRLAGIYRRTDAPLSLIGWSLGGIYARQLARRNPDAIRQVVTLGSPFRLASHDQSNARRLYERYQHLHVERWELPLEGGQGPLPVPATSVYSRLDGIVAWQACVDDPSERAENVEVCASHFGFGHHPAVLWLIADRLAQRPAEWAPFRPPTWLRFAYPSSKGRAAA